MRSVVIVVLDAHPVCLHDVAVAELSDVKVRVSEQDRVADDLLSGWVVDVALKPGITLWGREVVVELKRVVHPVIVLHLLSCLAGALGSVSSVSSVVLSTTCAAIPLCPSLRFETSSTVETSLSPQGVVLCTLF